MFKLKRELGMSFLIISHDLYFISHMADRILVMYNGDIVEEGAAKDVLAHPKTEYTKELFKAALNSNPHYSSFR